MESAKDFERYAYFTSKARNYAICIRPERKAIVDGETVTKDEGLRVEFNNGMLRLEKTVDNMAIIDFLRERIAKEISTGPNSRMIFEEDPIEVMIPENKVRKALSEKNAEIEKLKGQLASQTPSPKEVLEKNKK